MKFRSHIFRSELAAAAYTLVTNQEIWLDHAKRMLEEVDEIPAPTRVLDVGCGPGTSTRALSRALNSEDRICGVDLSWAMIGRAARYERESGQGEAIPYLVADACHLPFSEGSFGVVTGHSFLYLVPDRLAVLHEIVRVLQPGGSLIFLEPNRNASVAKSAFAGARRWRVVKNQPASAALFAASMVGWRVASRVAGRLSVDKVTELFIQAGLGEIKVLERLGGLGLLCVGRKPG